VGYTAAESEHFCPTGYSPYIFPIKREDTRRFVSCLRVCSVIVIVACNVIRGQTALLRHSRTQDLMSFPDASPASA
jgi:hypothetical protein